jgi:hypothetical protein
LSGLVADAAYQSSTALTTLSLVAGRTSTGSAASSGMVWVSNPDGESSSRIVPSGAAVLRYSDSSQRAKRHAEVAGVRAWRRSKVSRSVGEGSSSPRGRCV